MLAPRFQVMCIIFAVLFEASAGSRRRRRRKGPCDDLPSVAHLLKSGSIFSTQVYNITSVTGLWVNIFSAQNVGDESVTETKSYTTGYSETDSVTTATTWTASAGAVIKDLTASSSWSEVTTKYSSESWSESETSSITYTVPGETSATFYQRQVQEVLAMQSTCISVTGYLSYCISTGDNPYEITVLYETVLAHGIAKCTYKHPAASPTLVFNTDCYSTSSDEATRDAFCPVNADRRLQAMRRKQPLLLRDRYIGDSSAVSATAAEAPCGFACSTSSSILV